jgi:hypothetical protein
LTGQVRKITVRRTARAAARGGRLRGRRRVEFVEAGQTALLFLGWVMAFMLGKELQTGFAQWRQMRRGK